MTEFVLVQQVRAGETEDMQPIYQDIGWYALYHSKGPIIKTTIEDAYRFPNKEFAERVRAGDERLQTFVIKEFKHERM